jgi:hypothetical protein
LPIKKAQLNLLFGSIPLKHVLHFEYWNQPLNMRMRFRYVDCHEAGLCCYLVIHIENILHPLQLFYFHLWPIYYTGRERERERETDGIPKTTFLYSRDWKYKNPSNFWDRFSSQSQYFLRRNTALRVLSIWESKQ